MAVNWSPKVAFPSLVEDIANELLRSEVEDQATNSSFKKTAASDFFEP